LDQVDHSVDGMSELVGVDASASGPFEDGLASVVLEESDRSDQAPGEAPLIGSSKGCW
jgi:hypothetical protein